MTTAETAVREKKAQQAREALPKVACIVLNLNGRDLLVSTLYSLRKQTYPALETIVVDNGSNDGSQDAVRQLFPELRMIENGRNLGFGGGNNVGMQHALDRGFDWILLLNNDVEVHPGLVYELVAVGEGNKAFGIVGPKIFYFDNPGLLWYAGGVIRYFTGTIAHRGIRERDIGRYDRAEATDYVTGCAMLIRRSVLDEIGLFDPVYHPIYTEDADLCARAQGRGYSLVYAPAARLWHKVSSFSGGGTTPFKVRLKVVHNLIFFRRYARWYHWPTIPVAVFAAAVIWAVRELLRGNVRLVTALLSGFGEAIRRLFGKGAQDLPAKPDPRPP